MFTPAPVTDPPRLPELAEPGLAEPPGPDGDPLPTLAEPLMPWLPCGTLPAWLTPALPAEPESGLADDAPDCDPTEGGRALPWPSDPCPAALIEEAPTEPEPAEEALIEEAPTEPELADCLIETTLAEEAEPELPEPELAEALAEAEPPGQQTKA